MKKLLIVESPSKAKTIGKYVGKGYDVKASVGHVRDLPKSNKNAIDIESGFVPNYIIPPKKKDVVKDLRDRAKKASEVILATDPDREGEAIAWHIAEILKDDVPSSNIKRITFHEITEEAVNEALKNPRSIDDDLRQAQEARRVLDRLVGYDLSGLIWKKVRYGLSAGRVQSPALRILVEREREIRAFKSEKYYVIEALLKHGKVEIPFIASEEPKEKEQVERILKEARKYPWSVISVEEKENNRKPPAPFKTSTLQQAASSRLGFAPSRTMRVAQKLYEAGLITYMRTDSITISNSAQQAIVKEVKKLFGNEYADPKQYKTKSKSAQEAHEAIRPTHIENRSAGTTEEEKKLYGLIWKRALASQMKPARVKVTKVTANIDGRNIPDFRASGIQMLFPGWLKAEPNLQKEDRELPAIKEGDHLELLDITAEEKETQPPNRYSEAGLIKELEKRGIGRPSTYATIINTLLNRGYVEKLDRALHPTDTGEVVSEFLENHFARYISDSFTAEMEDELDDIAGGKRKYEKTIKDFYTPFHKEVDSKKDIEKVTTLGDAPKEFPCPTCGAPMIIKLGRSGRFMSCSRFPDCEGARTIEGEEMKGPEATGEICPECGGNLVLRHGRYGQFIACENYPKCKYVKENEEEKARKSTGVTCPLCNKGEIIERRGRFGPFYGCSNYPSCSFTIKAKPTGRMCTECGSLMMEGTKTIPERCSNKACPQHNPHKAKKE